MNYSFLRSAIAHIPHAYHGAIDFAELEDWGIPPDDILDFSVNSNPFGHPDVIHAALATAPFHRYPDKACLALRREIVSHLKIDSIDSVLVGNGTAELLFLICFACLEPADSVLVLAPTFGEYGRMAQLMGADVVEYHAQERNNFVWEPDVLMAHLDQHRPKLCFLCNPNNPTGQVVATSQIIAWADAYPQTLFVIDEAYLNFVPNLASVCHDRRPNLISLRSMTKDYAVAGLRLGYLVGEPKLVQGIAAGQVPWSVNELAQTAGVAVLQAHDQFVADWSRLCQTTAKFQDGLRELGFAPLFSHTHYFLLPVANGRAFRQHMLRRRILVRLAESYHLPQMVRVSTQIPEMNERFLAAAAKWGKSAV